MAAKTKGTTSAVADFSADFEVEDVIAAPRAPAILGRGRDPLRSSGGGAGPRQSNSKSTSRSGSGTLPTSAVQKQPVAELDEHRLAQRQKQVDYGKNTLGYQRYVQQVPKDKRRKKGEQWLDPPTPDIFSNVSKRCFDGQIKVWRRALHKYDMQDEEQAVKLGSLATRDRLARERAAGDDAEAATMSGVPSPPSDGSRGSLDGYLGPGSKKKRGFQKAFDSSADAPSYPSKLLTSPAGPRPYAPRSAPPAAATETTVAPTPAGRCDDPPREAHDRSSLRAGGLPPVPQTAPPAAQATKAVAASTTAAPQLTRGSGAAATTTGDELFQEWVDEDYAELEPFEEDELDYVGL